MLNVQLTVRGPTQVSYAPTAFMKSHVPPPQAAWLLTSPRAWHGKLSQSVLREIPLI